VEPTENTLLKGLETDEPLPCKKCSHHSQAVSQRIVLFTVRPQFLEEALNGTFRFCPDRECAIVYFEEKGSRVFTVDDLRLSVGVKASIDPIPLCYCFGFDESHLREEIAQTGTATIPERISHLICQGLCACDVRNPSGKCCLGEVIKTAKRLQLEAIQSPTPALR
jgi:Zinc binding domain